MNSSKLDKITRLDCQQVFFAAKYDESSQDRHLLVH